VKRFVTPQTRLAGLAWIGSAPDLTSHKLLRLEQAISKQAVNFPLSDLARKDRDNEHLKKVSPEDQRALKMPEYHRAGLSSHWLTPNGIVDKWRHAPGFKSLKNNTLNHECPRFGSTNLYSRACLDVWFRPRAEMYHPNGVATQASLGKRFRRGEKHYPTHRDTQWMSPLESEWQ